MADTGYSSFNTTVDKTNRVLNEIEQACGWTKAQRNRSYAALRAVLHAVRDRLTVDASAQFAAQLPMLIRGMYYDGWNPSAVPVKTDKEEFLARVRREYPFELDGDVEELVHAVLDTLETPRHPGRVGPHPDEHGPQARVGARLTRRAPCPAGGRVRHGVPGGVPGGVLGRVVGARPPPPRPDPPAATADAATASRGPADASTALVRRCAHPLRRGTAPHRCASTTRANPRQALKISATAVPMPAPVSASARPSGRPEAGGQIAAVRLAGPRWPSGGNSTRLW